MMNNLFSMFDPSSSLAKLSLIMILIPMMMMKSKMKKNQTKSNTMMNKINKFIKKEISQNMSKIKQGQHQTFSALMFMLLTYNVMALLPQNFTVTSMLTTNLTLAMIMWMIPIMIGWTKNPKHTMAHLVPQGTPTPLMNIMVLIEMTSVMIRPITLSVRLTANLLAGHLLMTLLSNFMMSSEPTTQMMMIPTAATLVILETAVASIQAYVFMTLVSLYTEESN